MRFENLSDDPELGYFCEGVSEDIVSAFGNIEQLTVVSNEHNSAFSEQESTHYVLTGKAGRAGSRIRISAQLVDRHTGVQHWADRFDRDTADLFEAQDNVARNIVIAVHTALGAGSHTNRWQWGTENFEAWQIMAKGFHEFQKFSPENLAKAAAMFEQALVIDPDYLAPLMASSYCYGHLAWIADGDAAHSLIERAQAAVDRSVAQAPDDVRPYAAMRAIEFARGNHDAAVAVAETALAMAPNDSYCRATLAFALTSVGRSAEALAQMTMAARDIPTTP
ncbi:MAG: hypothetical protein N2B03_05920 [Boseongicola sp.]